MIRGFKEFVLRGNVIDLAVAFVVGAAFAALFGSISESLIQPIVGIILGGGIDAGTITIRDQVIDITKLLNAVITFLITLAVIYLILVAPMNKYRERRGQGGIDARPADVVLLTEIRDLLKQQEGKS